jgi:hypothetical protein
MQQNLHSDVSSTLLLPSRFDTPYPPPPARRYRLSLSLIRSFRGRRLDSFDATPLGRSLQCSSFAALPDAVMSFQKYNVKSRH